MLVHPGRYDLSVNVARVENAQASAAFMFTGTALNNPGAFTGSGFGNKAILGCKGWDGVPLGSIAKLEWEWKNVSLLESNLFRFPYLNVVLEVAPSQLKILAIDPNAPALLNTGSLLSTGPDSWRFTWLASANYVQVVNAFTAQVASGIVPAMPVVSPPVPIAAGAGPSWPSASFRVSDILASFPNAVLRDIYTGDGGLPGPSGVATITPSLMLVVGGSTFRSLRYTRLDKFEVNDSPA